MKIFKTAKEETEEDTEDGQTSHTCEPVDLTLWKCPSYQNKLKIQGSPIKILMQFFTENEKC